MSELFNKNSGTGIRRLLNACRWSIAGFRSAIQHEEAFRQEVWLALVLIPLAIWLADNGIQLALMLGSVLLVLMVEILNSAVEAVVDRIGMERHKLSGRAKDMGSAAVMLSLINVLVVWGLVLFY